ncbi:MAG: hypothetical protein RL042_1372, partial [Nitrospirota bacterium]
MAVFFIRCSYLVVREAPFVS